MIILRILILFVLLSMPLLANSAMLSAGTLIPVRLTENVNGNINKVGETIYFQVIEDILVDGDLVIRQGTFVNGKISEATERKSLGKGGELSLVPRSLETEAGQTVRFRQDPLSAEGRKRTGATVAHTIVWGPLGLFAKGRAAYIFLDTEYDIEVSNDVELSPVVAGLEERTKLAQEGNKFIVAFEPYRKKINYQKGKIQDDFVMIVQNAAGEQEALHKNSVRITRVLDYDLPENIEPVGIKFNSREKENEVSFSFKDIVKYITPGSSKITLEIESGNPELYTATLETEWKLN